MIFAHLLEVVIVFELRFLLKRDNGKRDVMQGIDRSHADREILEEYERDLDASAFGDLTDRENLNSDTFTKLIRAPLSASLRGAFASK
jgi:hypothetical protein